MRFIPTFCLREGMTLGESIYNINGTLLLTKGSQIKDRYINKIIELGVQGVYIEDAISKDIEIKNVISDELRIKAVYKVKDLFIGATDDKVNTDTGMSNVGNMMEDIVDELLENKDVMVNIMDIKLFDDYTFFHSVNVAVLSVILGIGLNLNRAELYNLGMGALLHDIGKVFVSKECLNKKGKLTDEEFERMKAHPLEGYRYIKSRYDIPLSSAITVLQHHEKYNGTGYPNGRSGNNISLFGRIVAITDVYDAITSDRPYRKGVLPSKAMEYIMAGVGQHFDFELVNLFIRRVAAYPVGTCVKLSNGVIGIVVENFPDACTRPKIRVINDDYNDEDKEYTYINLKDDFRNNNLIIVDIVYI